MRNYIKHTTGLMLFILAALLLMNFLPPITVGEHTLREVDILSDIRRPSFEEDEPQEDSLLLAPPPIIKPAFVDSCKQGMTCIEDYSDSTLRGMTAFYEKLSEINNLKRPVRVAVFGDSFIEADIFTADLREMLQQKYGGCGVGFVNITSTTYGFRPTVRHAFNGWESHSVNDSIGFVKNKQGPNNHYFIPTRGAYMELRGQTKYASKLDTCQQSTIYFLTDEPLMLTAEVNKQKNAPSEFTASPDMQQMSVKGNIGSVRWIVNSDTDALFFGATMDGLSGISVDNFSLRGSSGLSLATIPEHTMMQFNKLRTYDLIILQFGLNVATQRGSDYHYYKVGMLRSVEYIKRCFPQASILLVSVGDRNYKSETGEMRTMPGVKNLIKYQQNIAAEGNIAFWNLYEAMGGEGGMVKLVNAKPAQANMDYTHINFRGGKVLSKLLYESLVYGKEQFDKKKAYEAE
ncbi:hypothetical protein D0T50_08365 [Bacteroides sp. 214]|uniref:SGNH/GDSL hydrolase family protein n=1 Tax=Bacteroides sp. 214 TaxID=2302935 RepID=UPI0013D67E0F|nr:SGNH/GDSL hydrolase family protein [Bacteroides sp. 214]NDW12905.1 hypothetical protein [Bacteroides sp. 214]